MNYAVSNKIGKQLCEALGIDVTGVCRVVMDIGVNEVVRFEVTRFATVNQIEGMCEVISKYRLVPESEAKPEALEHHIHANPAA